MSDWMNQGGLDSFKQTVLPDFQARGRLDRPNWCGTSVFSNVSHALLFNRQRGTHV
jgi:hypothetical protein